MSLRYHEYIGDGVYTSFDGYQIWLHVGDHRNTPVVALEPDVLNNLIEYAKSLPQRIEEEKLSATPATDSLATKPGAEAKGGE